MVRTQGGKAPGTPPCLQWAPLTHTGGQRQPAAAEGALCFVRGCAARTANSCRSPAGAGDTSRGLGARDTVFLKNVIGKMSNAQKHREKCLMNSFKPVT